MAIAALSLRPAANEDSFDIPPEDQLFESIALDLLCQGYSVQTNALPIDLQTMLHHHVMHMPEYKFDEAAVGRQQSHQQASHIRNDQIAWINGESCAGAAWLQWMQALQVYLNRRLFLGLFSFESHFAHYAPGHFYQRHFDAFKGDANRVLSTVTYLNPDWQSAQGGELIIYPQPGAEQGVKVVPELGTLTVFLSEEFEHEVCPSSRDRYSIAGWFRVNSTKADRVDPPR